MAHFNQMLSHDRDQTFTQKGLSNFEYLVATYPPSLFTAKAKEKIEICKKRLAAHEFYVGNFYYKHGNFKAASLCFQGLPEKFPKMDQEDKVLFLLGKSYLELDQGEKAREAFTRLIAEYPQSSHYGEAKTILQQNMNEKKVKESKKKGEVQEVEPEPFPLVKFEEERRQFLQFNAPLPATSQSVKPNLHPKAEIGLEMKLEEEKRMVVFPGLPNPSGEKEKPKEEASPDLGEAKLADTSQPIDITSDRVETYSKENLIIFRGNVIARQKDVVIYADSIEAVTVGDGKGIERVVASGNVKVQQGLRVANCQKAVFYNLERKIFLTGEPKVWEGENMISGDEIVFDIAQNRVEVKGGVGGRGKVKIHSGGEFEKKK
jgi:lipopolysaccharide transport protein LptA